MVKLGGSVSLIAHNSNYQCLSAFASIEGPIPVSLDETLYTRYSFPSVVKTSINLGGIENLGEENEMAKVVVLMDNAPKSLAGYSQAIKSNGFILSRGRVHLMPKLEMWLGLLFRSKQPNASRILRPSFM